MYISDLYFYMYHVHLMKSQFDFNKNDETETETSSINGVSIEASGKVTCAHKTDIIIYGWVRYRNSETF